MRTRCLTSAIVVGLTRAAVMGFVFLPLRSSVFASSATPTLPLVAPAEYERWTDSPVNPFAIF